MILRYARDIIKEKVYKLADYCPDCKADNLFAAFNGIYEKESRENSQILLQGALFKLRVHLPIQTKDLALKAKDILKDYSKDVYATKALPELLNIALLDQNDIFYKKLHDDQRFIDLVKRIESDINA